MRRTPISGLKIKILNQLAEVLEDKLVTLIVLIAMQDNSLKHETNVKHGNVPEVVRNSQILVRQFRFGDISNDTSVIDEEDHKVAISCLGKYIIRSVFFTKDTFNEW